MQCYVLCLYIIIRKNVAAKMNSKILGQPVLREVSHLMCDLYVIFGHIFHPCLQLP